MAVQKQDDQHEHTFSSYVRIRDVVLKTYLGRWTIGRSGERGSGISVLPARYDDDDEELLTVVQDNGFTLESEWQQSRQVTRILLSILADLNNAVVWMVSTRPLVSKSSSTCTNTLVSLQNASITMGITDNFVFQRFFLNPLSRYRYQSLFSASFSFTLWSAGTIIIIIIMSCRQHEYPWLSLATSPYHSSPLAGLQGYIPYPHKASVCMYVRAGRPAFARPYVGVHRSTSLMSSSLLLQQCPTCLVRLTCIVFVMGGRWPYSWCFVVCCL